MYTKCRFGFPIIKKIKETLFIVKNRQLLLDMEFKQMPMKKKACIVDIKKNSGKNT
jgi:hypothetical protein